MNMGKRPHIFLRLRKRFSRSTRSWERVLLHYTGTIRTCSQILAGLAFVASVACILLITAYTGYDHEALRTRSFMHYFHIIQGVFAANILLNLVFNFRETWRETRVIKWIVDIGVLLTLLPLLYPRPDNPWIHWLATVLYSNRFLLIMLVAYSIVDVSYGAMYVLGKRTNPSLILSVSFLFFIFIGAFLLMMPKCTYHGLPFVDALFVSTSAVCITGLTTVDIPSTFTPLGLLVLSVLIQTGGLGVMTFTSFFALFFSGNTSVYSQLMVKDMIYTKSINALLPTLLYILGFTLVVEVIGAVFIWLSIYNVLDMSLHDQLIFAAFHSLSAFCNAGFSNLPGGMANPALMNSNQSVYIVISIIVMAGSIGFPVLVNFKDAIGEYIRRIWGHLRGRRRFGAVVHVYNLNTKVSIVTTMIIFAVSATLFFILESNNSMAGFSLGDRVAQSVFNATTPRSSGFVSVNPASFLNVTLLMVMFLMWIGGASQSTAGGIKVNTFAAILINLRAIVLGRERVTAYKRTVSIGSVRRANAVVTLSILSYVTLSAVMLLLEPHLPVKSVLFETLSALFTVGSSLGITSQLSTAAKVVLAGAMFLGRVGIISLLIGVTGDRHGYPVKYPTDNIIIN